MGDLVNWLHGLGAVLVGNRDVREARENAELQLLTIACDSEAAPPARMVALRYLKNPHVQFVDPDTKVFLADLHESEDPRDREVIAEAQKKQ